jgi:hypothetical protein
VTIVQLSDLDDFLKDSLSIVRRGVANARNANQSNPALGIMADLPDKVDFEIMVVSNHQSLSRVASTTSSDSSSISEILGSRENGGSLTGGSSVESNSKSDLANESSLDTSSITNSKKADSGSSSFELDSETSNGNSKEYDNSSSKGYGTSDSNEKGTRSENRSATNTSSNNKNEKSKSMQIGRTRESNKHQVKGFDQSTGRWGGQNFAPVQPERQELKCS